MNSTTLKSIKWESVNAIFSTITEAAVISRAEIAEATGLSLVTVGKVADALLERGILHQEKEIRTSAGRRAGLLTLNANRFAIVLDLSCKDFRLSIIDLRLHLVEKLQYSYKNDRLYEENLRSILYDISDYLRKRYDLSNCFGIGVCTPGPYDPDTDTADDSRIPEIRDIPLRSIIQEYLPGLAIYLDAGENMAALSNISEVPDYRHKTILYLFLSEEVASGAIVINGEFLHGYKRQTCDFSKILLPDNTLFLTALRACKTTDTLIPVLTPLVHLIIQILSPAAILMECETIREDRESVVPLLREAMCQKYQYDPDTLTELIGTCCKFRHAHRGIARTLREMWLDKYIINTEPYGTGTAEE